ncbi:1885_t:CDS:2, partial [Diversispora eburnea]
KEPREYPPENWKPKKEFYLHIACKIQVATAEDLSKPGNLREDFKKETKYKKEKIKNTEHWYASGQDLETLKAEINNNERIIRLIHENGIPEHVNIGDGTDRHETLQKSKYREIIMDILKNTRVPVILETPRNKNGNKK